MEDQGLEKAFELLTACSNQAMNDECQHFGNVIATKLRNYSVVQVPHCPTLVSQCLAGIMHVDVVTSLR